MSKYQEDQKIHFMIVSTFLITKREPIIVEGSLSPLWKQERWGNRMRRFLQMKSFIPRTQTPYFELGALNKNLMLKSGPAIQNSYIVIHKMRKKNGSMLTEPTLEIR